MFLIFSQHRNGSKLLCSLFDSHPDIVCPHESINLGGVDYLEIAEKLKAENPGKIIGLHGHYPSLSEDALKSSIPKIFLYREDEILGGIKQSLMGIHRPNKLFWLSPEVVSKNYLMRENRNKVFSKYSTAKISYENLTKGRNIKSIPKGQTKKLLHLIGADYHKLTTNVSKEPESLPNNMEEIYNACKS